MLPVCSLGVIPIAREMRRAGVRSGTILAFVMAAPHINPLSLLYGLTLSEPLVIICFAAASLLLALLAGAVWDRWLDAKADEAEPSTEPTPAPGIKWLAAVVVAAAREAVNPTMGFVLIGLVFTGVMAGSLPHGLLGRTMRHDDWLAPLQMAAFALPAYLGPLQGMMRLGPMFEHGNSVGAAFVLFELGIGINVGLICWLMMLFGWRRVLLWLAILTGATLALAYASEKPLYFATEEAGHTHAFDDWTSPFQAGDSVPLAIVASKILQKVEILEPVSLAGFVTGGCRHRTEKIHPSGGSTSIWPQRSLVKEKTVPFGTVKCPARCSGSRHWLGSSLSASWRCTSTTRRQPKRLPKSAASAPKLSLP